MRKQAEYNSGHLRNTFLADWTRSKAFAERVKSLDKTKPVYTYCLSGGRSDVPAKKLEKLVLMKYIIYRKPDIVLCNDFVFARPSKQKTLMEIFLLLKAIPRICCL
ncbi:MAG: rhodanese-like domain-containing protein [Segetibacter sp.]